MSYKRCLVMTTTGKPIILGMKNEQIVLWSRIKAYQIDDPDSAYKFSQRLAKENGWSRDYTLRVIEEYKKFIFLCCVNPPATPSDPVDQCWHLHMIYTRSYWNDFCRDTLGQEVHHGPTRGGSKEQKKYKTFYDNTANNYKQFFGEPPVDIWQDNETRFKDIDFQRINMRRNWVIPKPNFKKLKQFFAVIVLTILAFLSIQGTSEPDSDTATAFLLALILGVPIIVFIIYLIVNAGDNNKRKKNNRNKNGNSSDSSSSGCGVFFFGGCGGSGKGGSGDSGCSSSDSGGSGCGSSGCGGGCGGS